jgi:dihydrofolate synthase/folylpolyglutamate synthase
MSNTEKTSLAEWVDYIQTLHHREIELSLERVDEVFRRLYPRGVDFKVITIAGTNGKGSTAELVASIFSQSGFGETSYQVGKFTSPHILKFNERFRINQDDVNDADLLAAFSRVEAARQSTPITFFEYGTLLAIVLFANAGVDIAVMEVGLGGRLDSVNILDADVTVVTNISIDHTAWLGNTIEEIALEKISIARANRPCIIGMANPPNSIVEYCRKHTIQPSLIGHQFSAELNAEDNTWQWLSSNLEIDSLPLPFGQGGHQLDNAAVAVQTVLTLAGEFPLPNSQIRQGLLSAHLAGRCQLIADNPKIIVDVSHNVASIAALGEFVKSQKITGRVVAVCGMLRDKQIGDSLVQLSSMVDEWCIASLANPRGASAAHIEDQLRNALASQNKRKELKFQKFASVIDAYNVAKTMLTGDDCLLVFGSFFVVSDIIGLALTDDRVISVNQ